MQMKEKSRLPDNPGHKYSCLATDAMPEGKAALVIFITMAFVLWVDWLVPLWGQILAALMAWGLVIVLYRSMSRTSQLLLLSCLVVATMGEIFCSLIWKLYDYRMYNIPPYVPPGHLLMFLLGSALAPRMPRLIVWFVPALVAPYVILGFWLGFDKFGIFLFVMFLACLVAEKDRRFYATMFMLCLLLEIYGTMLGNWTWRAEVPVWGMSNTNPPLASGTFYCLLDFLMFRLAILFWSGRSLYGEIASRFRQFRTGHAH
jgi:hypothetical protein